MHASNYLDNNTDSSDNEYNNVDNKASFQTAAAGTSGFLTQTAQQVWGWLGAADSPDDDLPYGYDSAAVAARSEEKQQLENIRQQMQAEVAAQLQAMEARETARERSIAQLRSELAQAPPVAAEATALVSRLHAETREKATLEAAMQASKAESAARNQELDNKIQQLCQLIERLNSQPAAPAPAGEPAAPIAANVHATPVAAEIPVSAPVPAPRQPVSAFPTPIPPPPTTPSAQPMPATSPFTGKVAAARARLQVIVASTRLRQLLARHRGQLGLAVVVTAMLGFGAWGLGHLSGSPPVPYQENGRWGFADAKGQPVIPAQFTAASPFQAGRAVVAKAGAYGFVNEDGKEVVAPAYDALNPYAGGYARARVGDAYTFVDEQGEEFDTYYFNALDFSEGHAAVLDHRGWYYITGPAEPTKPVIFIEAYSFVDGLARVKLADGYTYVTPAYLTDPSQGTNPFGRYQLAADFANGKARVTQGGRSFLIDKDGEEVQ